MKSINLDATIEFQEVFYHDGIYSPYESVKSEVYFPMVILGEIGTMLNSYTKQLRSPNNYSKEIENDCADIFICTLIYALFLRRKHGFDLLRGIDSNWSTESKVLSDETEFQKAIITLMDKIGAFFDQNEKNYGQEYFLEIFELIKSITFYVTHKEWQEIIDDFHEYTFDKFTEFERYTPDFWYRGSCWVNFEKLLIWGENNDMKISPKRALFLERMKDIQNRS